MGSSPKAGGTPFETPLYNKQDVKNNPVIRKRIAFLMVLLFLFSITPKKHWHDLLAAHTDTYAAAVAGEATLSPEGFNCHADDLVVSTPFIEIAPAAETVLLPAYTPYTLFCPSRFFSSPSKAKDSRGPPAVL
jgi:hypothetical protein